MTVYKDATITIYNLNDQVVGSSNEGGGRYPITGLLAGDYYYEIKSTNPDVKGSIREYFTIPKDDSGKPNIKFLELVGTVTQKIYDAAPPTTISIIDRDNAGIDVGVTLKVNNLPYTLEESSNRFMIGDISTRPDGSVLSFTSMSYENKKIKRLFPIPLNEYEETLYPKFTIPINFIDRSTNKNHVIEGATFQYISDDVKLTGDDLVIETFYLKKSGGSFTIPKTQAYNGTLKLVSLSTTIYSVITADDANIKIVRSDGAESIAPLNFKILNNLGPAPGDDTNIIGK